MTKQRITRRLWMGQAAAGTLALSGCGSPGGAKPGAAGGFKLGLVYFAPEEGADLCMKGLFDGLTKLGLVEGKNLEVRRAHAQAEIANIPQLIQNYDNQDVDAIVVMTTPCLAAACTMAKKKPVVFMYVYDPIAAGAGTTLTEHLPHITGVGSFPPVAETIDVIQKMIPGIKAVGTLFNTSEASSVKVVGVGREIFRKRGIRLEEVAATSTGEVFQAAQVLTHRDVQALWVTGDNTALQSFDGVAKAAADAHLPLFINDPEFTKRGAVASIGLGWYEAGSVASALVDRVVRGENPRDIPFEEIVVKKVVLNKEAAERLKLRFPADLLKDAQTI